MYFFPSTFGAEVPTKHVSNPAYTDKEFKTLSCMIASFQAERAFPQHRYQAHDESDRRMVAPDRVPDAQAQTARLAFRRPNAPPKCTAQMHRPNTAWVYVVGKTQCTPLLPGTPILPSTDVIKDTHGFILLIKPRILCVLTHQATKHLTHIPQTT